MQGRQTTTRQITITQAVASKSIASAERIKICEDWVATCTAVNIPLSKSDHPALRKFLKEKVVNSGAIPGSHQLQEKYLGDVYLQGKESLKTNFAKKPVAVIFDETPDVEGRCILNVLIAALEKDESGRILAYLADTVFLEQCNHSSVSMAVVKCLQEYNIDNDDVTVFNTDNAAYMKKAYTAVLKSLFPNSVHVTCMAHIMNFVGGAFQRPFDQLNSFMLNFPQMFFHAGSHKRRYLQFMTKNLPPGRKATMAPDPCATRWNSWFTAVQYHSEHFGLYKEFIEKEIDTCGKTTPPSVERLHEMLQDPNMAQSLQVQISIMADKCRGIIGLLGLFQSRRPIVTKVFDYLEDLHMKLEANKDLSFETCAEYFEGVDLSFANKMQILNRVEQAYINAEDKLSKYMSDGQPAIHFLKEVRVFDPRHTAFMNDSVSSYESIPSFRDVPQDELDAYFTRLGPAAVHAAACGVVDLDAFWDGLQERLPKLRGLAIRYKSVIVSSADAEGSNSIYKLVLSRRRTSVTNDNLKALVFLYHNQRLTSGAFEDEDFEEAFDEA